MCRLLATTIMPGQMGFGLGRLVRQRHYETPSGFVTSTPPATC